MKNSGILIFLFLISFLANAQDRPVGKSFITRSEVVANHAMAATSQPLATQIALDILKKGGRINMENVEKDFLIQNC